MARTSSPRRRWFSIGALVLTLAALVWIYSPDRLILIPSREPRASIGATRRALPFRGGELEIWTSRSRTRPPASQPDFYLLRFYGNGDRADDNVGLETAGWTAACSVEVWGVNYPGFGGSTGPARLSSIGPAALAAYDALRREAEHRPIIVFGTSLGTTAALYTATQRPVAGLILQNPPPLRQIVLRQFGWWNLWLLAGPVALRIPSALDSVANARAVHVPCAFLLAANDEMVKPAYQRLIVDAYAGPKRIIPLLQSQHNDPLSADAIKQFNAAVRWILAAPTVGRAPRLPETAQSPAGGAPALQPE